MPTLLVIVTGASSVARVSDTGPIRTASHSPDLRLRRAEPGLIGGAAAVAALVLVQGARNGGRLYLSGVDPTLFASWETDGTLARLGDVHVEPATDVIGESTQPALEDAFRLARPGAGASPPGW